MFWKKTQYTNSMEILVTDANLATFTGTVKRDGVIADESGKKYALAGSVIDAEGNVVTETGDTGSETVSSTPVGILFRTVDVTYGDMPCSLVVEGYLRADRVLDGFADSTITAIKAALPNIKFR